jgi:hypothetical protein
MQKQHSKWIYLSGHSGSNVADLSLFENFSIGAAYG